MRRSTLGVKRIPRQNKLLRFELGSKCHQKFLNYNLKCFVVISFLHTRDDIRFISNINKIAIFDERSSHFQPSTTL